MKKIQVCSNEGPRPFPNRDNKKKGEKALMKLIFFPRTAGPISTKLGTMHPWMKGIQVCLNLIHQKS